MNKIPREVIFPTIINILKQKPQSLLFAGIFTTMSLFLLTGFLIIFSSFDDDAPAIDRELINSKGKEINAVITDIEIQYNITINNVHPTIISYQYSKDEKIIDSKYIVLEEEKIENMEIGDEITILEYDGNSLIKGLNPMNSLVILFY